jgi:hypothetical protein
MSYPSLFYFQGTCSSLFKINQNGDIKTTAKIDRDTGDVYDASGVCVLNVMVSLTIFL